VSVRVVRSVQLALRADARCSVWVWESGRSMGSFSGRLRQQSGLVPAATSARHRRFHVLACGWARCDCLQSRCGSWSRTCSESSPARSRGDGHDSRTSVLLSGCWPHEAEAEGSRIRRSKPSEVCGRSPPWSSFGGMLRRWQHRRASGHRKDRAPLFIQWRWALGCPIPLLRLRKKAPGIPCRCCRDQSCGGNTTGCLAASSAPLHIAAQDQRTVRVVRHPNRGRSSPRGIREAGIRVGRSDVLWVRHASGGRCGSSSKVRALRRGLIVSTATLAGRSEPFMGSSSRGTCLGDGSGSSTSTPLAGTERRRRNATSVARTRLREVLVLGGRLCSRESSSAVLAPLMRRLRRTLRWLGIGGNIVSWLVVLMTRSMLALFRRTSR
jgi:hypothetical protein